MKLMLVHVVGVVDGRMDVSCMYVSKYVRMVLLIMNDPWIFNDFNSVIW